MLYWLLGLVAVPVVLLTLAGAVLYLLGSRLPTTHTASGSIDLSVPPDRAFALIADVKGMADWPGSEITAVEELPPENGLPVVRQRMGRNAFVLRTTELAPPHAPHPHHRRRGRPPLLRFLDLRRDPD